MTDTTTALREPLPLPGTNFTRQGAFFDFETSKVQSLSLSQLERTYKENDIHGNPVMGIYHCDLIRTIIEKAARHGYLAYVWDLFAAQNKERTQPGVVILPQVEEIYGRRAVEAHILRRVFANIRLIDFDTEKYTTSISVAFHQRGIQVGFGNMVKICHNQCMMGYDHYVATYSRYGEDEAMDIPYILQSIDKWLDEAPKRITREREMIERYMGISISADEMRSIIGELTEIRIRRDTRLAPIKRGGTYPLNQGQICALAEKMFLSIEVNGSGNTNAWELYNAATNIYKADGMDLSQILPQNLEMVAYINNRYGIEPLRTVG